MSRAAQISSYAERFHGRLKSSLIDQALDYLQYNEEPLAFEILCEHLFENEVPMSAAECSVAEELAAELGIECNAVRRIRELEK